MGLIFPSNFMYEFFEKNVSHVIFCYLFFWPEFIVWLFTSWDIGLWRFARFCTICTILKNVKNIHGRVLLSVKLLADVCNFAKRNTPPWVSFTLLKLYKWYQIAQRTTYVHYVVISFPLNNVIKLTTLKPLKVACRVRVTYFKE